MFEIPAIEKLSNPTLFAILSDDPAAREAVKLRAQSASAICQYLTQPERSTRDAYYSGAASLLSMPENARLALYLPLEELEEAPVYFRKSYLKAWLLCLSQADVRENFNLGDSLEIAARDENFPYVVKAAHLIPWLLKYKYLNEAEVLELAREGNMQLLSSICNCEKLFYNIHFVTSPSFQLAISKLARTLPKRESKPLFSSPKRQKWLNDSKNEAWGRITPHNITGPFSANYYPWETPKPQGDEIILIGGSHLKGYSATTSDSDYYFFDPFKKRIKDFCEELKDHSQIPDQNIAHICLDTIWTSRRLELSSIHRDCILQYLKLPADSIARRQSLERLEQDLLQYRLMHKGIKRIYENVSENTQYFTDIDGASAFYDRRYRRIASQLFAKYVFLPQL